MNKQTAHEIRQMLGCIIVCIIVLITEPAVKKSFTVMGQEPEHFPQIYQIKGRSDSQKKSNVQYTAEVQMVLNKTLTMLFHMLQYTLADCHALASNHYGK